MLRRLVFLLTVLSSLFVMAPAWAVPPVREFHPTQDDVVITGQCASPVLAHVEGGETITTYFNASGTPVKQIQIFPANTLTFTSMGSGRSITVMGTGATIVRAATDGGVSVQITGHGPFVPHPLTGEPGIWYLSGRARATFDADGTLTSGVVRGRLDDLCARLGG